jgi:exonuclease VII small subunit
MSKITNVRLPNMTSPEYDAQQFNQLVRSLEQIVLQLNSSYTSYVSENKDTGRTWFGI